MCYRHKTGAKENWLHSPALNSKPAKKAVPNPRGGRKQPVQPIKIIGINKLGTLLSSQTTDASEILGKTFECFSFLFAAVFLYSISSGPYLAIRGNSRRLLHFVRLSPRQSPGFPCRCTGHRRDHQDVFGGVWPPCSQEFLNSRPRRLRRLYTGLRTRANRPKGCERGPNNHRG